MSEITASAKAEESEKRGPKTPRAKKPAKTTEPSFNMDELRDLAGLVEEHGFTDFEFENENIRVRMSKMTAAQIAPQAAAPHTTPAVSHSMLPAETAPPAVETGEDLFKITSPIVGTFYRSPGPDKEPYVKEGSRVTPDTIVCIVEAMKLMNEIQAETTGEVVEIYAENGQPVEYGQPLFGIRK